MRSILLFCLFVVTSLLAVQATYNGSYGDAEKVIITRKAVLKPLVFEDRVLIETESGDSKQIVSRTRRDQGCQAEKAHSYPKPNYIPLYPSKPRATYHKYIPYPKPVYENIPEPYHEYQSHPQYQSAEDPEEEPEPVYEPEHFPYKEPYPLHPRASYASTQHYRDPPPYYYHEYHEVSPPKPHYPMIPAPDYHMQPGKLPEYVPPPKYLHPSEKSEYYHPRECPYAVQYPYSEPDDYETPHYYPHPPPYPAMHEYPPPPDYQIAPPYQYHSRKTSSQDTKHQYHSRRTSSQDTKQKVVPSYPSPPKPVTIPQPSKYPTPDYDSSYKPPDNKPLSYPKPDPEQLKNPSPPKPDETHKEKLHPQERDKTSPLEAKQPEYPPVHHASKQIPPLSLTCLIHPQHKSSPYKLATFKVAGVTRETNKPEKDNQTVTIVGTQDTNKLFNNTRERDNTDN